MTTRAIDITVSLQRERSRVQKANVPTLLQVNTYCPNAAENNVQQFNLPIISETIRTGLEEIDKFMEEYVADAQVGLNRVSQASDYIDQTIYWADSNDWKPRLWVMFLNVINMFLIVGLIFSRNNIAYNPYRCLLTYFLVPVFVVCLILGVTSTCGFGGTAVVNAGMKEYSVCQIRCSRLSKLTRLSVTFLRLLRRRRVPRKPGRNH